MLSPAVHALTGHGHAQHIAHHAPDQGDAWQEAEDVYTAKRAAGYPHIHALREARAVLGEGLRPC